MMMAFLCAITAALRLASKTRGGEAESIETPSFDAVYGQHFAFAWRTMRGMGVRPGDIDDAVQDVFIIVHRKLGDYVPTASLRSWIFGIVRRVAKDHRRSVGRRGEQVPVDEKNVGVETADPYVTATRNQALALVESYANTLDDTRRAIFVLAELEQVSVPEIAQTLDINVNTVYARLKVIRRNLERFVTRHSGEGQGALYE